MLTPMKSLAELRLVTAVLALALLAGCVSSPLPPPLPDPPPRYTEAELQGKTYRVVHQFHALHCKRFAWDPASSEENGMRRLNALTAGYQIDGLVNVSYEKGYVSDLGMECWSSIRCEADGIRFE